jgi:hypothetical protein
MLDRREFLAALMAAALASRAGDVVKDVGLKNDLSLVPDTPSGTPNYWCTWAAQNYMYGHHLQRLDPKILEGASGSRLAHNAMAENILFGKGGWVEDFFPRIREDIFFLLDDGWQQGGTATFDLDTEKFPSFTGSAAEKLGKLHHAIESAGWRGAALWCRNTPGGAKDYHLETVSRTAGISYWKIDLGDSTFDLIRLRDETHIPLTLEHVHGELPVNGDWKSDGRFGPQPWGSSRMEILQHTDVYRTYDVTSILSLPTTLDRLAEMLKGANGHPGECGLLNVEDEVYVAASMGCTMGIMRFPLIGLRPGPDIDLFFSGPRQTKRRMDEVVRALRWQRIAPPFQPGSGFVKVSDEILTDSWVFAPGQTWQKELIGEEVRQGAPACIARNIDLPLVRSNGEKPFVFAALFPNGAVAIAAQERTGVGNAWHMPVCDVTLRVDDAPGPFGVFGSFHSLTLILDTPLRGRPILAQDLADDKTTDISDMVEISDKRLKIPGAVIRKVGLNHATSGDLSSPGLVISISQQRC